jgi:hypothetical protein
MFTDKHQAFGAHASERAPFQRDRTQIAHSLAMTLKAVCRTAAVTRHARKLVHHGVSRAVLYAVPSHDRGKLMNTAALPVSAFEWEANRHDTLGSAAWSSGRLQHSGNLTARHSH